MSRWRFGCVTYEGRLVTVNSKATASPRASGTDCEGNLRRPRIAKGQRSVDYIRVRGGLPSPVDADLDGQVLKVDLVLMRAQLFDVDDDGRLHAGGPVEDITEDVATVLRRYPAGPPPGPSAHDDL